MATTGWKAKVCLLLLHYLLIFYFGRWHPTQTVSEIPLCSAPLLQMPFNAHDLLAPFQLQKPRGSRIMQLPYVVPGLSGPTISQHDSKSRSLHAPLPAVRSMAATANQQKT
ncbi:hypothetical protein GGS20DRAFT_582736 [Poronia punctata]|nr:hypothetical protein GGS20DRAFT_582736 [Poronia punctata]